MISLSVLTLCLYRNRAILPACIVWRWGTSVPGSCPCGLACGLRNHQRLSIPLDCCKWPHCGAKYSHGRHLFWLIYTYGTNQNNRPANNFWSCFATISLTLVLTFSHMAPIHFDGEDVSTCIAAVDGPCVQSVNGEGGVLSSHTWQLSSTWFLRPMIHPSLEKIFSTPTESPP